MVSCAKRTNVRMNFRQRLAWVLLLIYLAGTVFAVHHIFELIDRYGAYTMEHTKTHHSTTTPRQQFDWSAAVFWQHLADVPLTVWLLLGCIPYIQFFCVLFLCTKSQPSVHFRNCIIPVIGWFYICRTKRHMKELGCALDNHVQCQKKEDLTHVESVMIN